jgi:hypothetical protein
VLHLLRHHRGGHIFTRENVRVSCVGGGPGSDIIAILKYLDEQRGIEPVTKLTFYLLDSEQTWADTWTELDESLRTDMHVNTNFQPLDVTERRSWQSQKKFLQADLFTMSFFLSEVFSLDRDGAVTAFWDKLFASAKPGALFVYTDNGHENFNNYFDELCRIAGLTLIIKKDNTRFTPRWSEQASELGEYLGKFGQSPRLQGHLSYRVLRKP